MSHTPAPTDGAHLSDRVVALLRTAVPALWGTIVAWALARLAGVLPTDLADSLGSALQSEAAVGVVVLAAITAWYALWRWAEPHVPAWLVRIVLGSAQTPHYAPQTPDGSHNVSESAVEIGGQVMTEAQFNAARLARPHDGEALPPEPPQYPPVGGF